MIIFSEGVIDEQYELFIKGDILLVFSDESEVVAMASVISVKGMSIFQVYICFPKKVENVEHGNILSAFHFPIGSRSSNDYIKQAYF